MKAFMMPGKPQDDSSMHLQVPTIIRTYETILKLYSSHLVKLLGSASSQCLENMLICLRDEKISAYSSPLGWLR